MTTRRDFCVAAAATAAGTLLPRGAWARAQAEQTPEKPARRPRTTGSEAEMTVEPLREDVWAIFGGGGTSLLLRRGESAMLVDTKQAQRGAELRRICVETAGADPGIVVNTHHHADHTGGNWAFRPPTVIFAQANAGTGISASLGLYQSRARGYVTWLQSENADPARIEAAREVANQVASATVADFMPTITVQDHRSISVGGAEVHMRWFGNAHTDNDLVVHVPELDLIHAGDLVFNQLIPYVDPKEGATTTGWLEALRQTLELAGDDTIVVAGHGAAGDRSVLAWQIGFFEQLREIVGAAIDAGKSRGEVGSMRPDAFRDLGYGRLLARTMVATYDEMIQESGAEQG